jgi:hypothetical protein
MRNACRGAHAVSLDTNTSQPTTPRSAGCHPPLVQAYRSLRYSRSRSVIPNRRIWQCCVPRTAAASPLIVLDLDLAAAASLSLGPASLTTNEIPKRGARPHTEHSLRHLNPRRPVALRRSFSPAHPERVPFFDRPRPAYCASAPRFCIARIPPPPLSIDRLPSPGRLCRSHSTCASLFRSINRPTLCFAAAGWWAKHGAPCEV